MKYNEKTINGPSSTNNDDGKSENGPSSTNNDEATWELLRRVTAARKKVPQYCAETERMCKQYEIDSWLNAAHDQLVPPDKIICSMPDEATKQYMKSLSEKQYNTDENFEEMDSVIKILRQAVCVIKLKKKQLFS